jgi:uncharacterized membrane protein YeaQ/YmgE (transglycosylase-associated protein family)
MPVDWLGTLVLGLVAGWGANRLMGSGRYGVIGDIVVGILGAFVGGWLAVRLLGISVTGLNVTSIAIAVVGAVIAIAVFRALAPRRRWFA